MVGTGQSVAEEHAPSLFVRLLLSREDPERVPVELRRNLGVGVEQPLELETKRLVSGLVALVGVVELLQGLEVVFRGEELLALDAQSLRDAKRLVRNRRIKIQ